MKKKILSAVLAITLVFGLAAALPQGALRLDSAITASAETFGDFEYTVLDDGTVEISEYNGGDNYITIPSYINGKKVTGIGSFAFAMLDSVSITIPEGVTGIGNNAFFSCQSLKNIVIPDSVTSIGDWAFGDCRSITSISIPNSVTSMLK